MMGGKRRKSPRKGRGLHIGDVVDTNAPRGRWYKYGEIIGIKGDAIKIRHPNGETSTYGRRQLHRVETSYLLR